MNKQEIIQFFDRLAPGWDASLVRHDDIIQTVLDNGGIRSGTDVLDVGCGTGILFPDYLDRNVNSLTAVDLSLEMVKIARSKYPESNIQVLCGDVEALDFGKLFDCIVIYNAFPHFPDPERLIKCLSQQLKTGGILTVAHGMSRAAIDQHHKGSASKVSIGLLHEDDLANIFSRYLTVTVKISDQRMYQVAGRK